MYCIYIRQVVVKGIHTVFPFVMHTLQEIQFSASADAEFRCYCKNREEADAIQNRYLNATAAHALDRDVFSEARYDRHRVDNSEVREAASEIIGRSDMIQGVNR